MDFIREVLAVCFGLKCPYEMPSGECGVPGNCEIPEDAECKKEEEDERI